GGRPGRPPAGGRVVRIHRLLVVGRRDVAGDTAARGEAPRAGQRVRSAPGLVAAGAVLPRTRGRADRLRHADGFHPRGVPAGGRAPVRRVLGLPGDVL